MSASTGPALDETLTTDALARLLVAQGLCDQRSIERSRRVADEAGERLDTVLLHLGLVSEAGLAQAFAAMLGTRVVSPERYPLAPLLPERLSPQFLRNARAMPIALVKDDGLVVAVVDPFARFVPAAIAAATGRRVSLQVAVPVELEAAFERLYPGAASEQSATETTAEAAAPLEEDTERLKDLASEAPVIRLVNQIIARAVETQASDIHIEPFDDGLRIRYRHDGILHEIEPPPAHLAPAIVSRVKIMARLDIAERRLPQDGRFRLAVRGRDVDFRISTIPSLYGEMVVLRVLDRSAVTFEYDKLGLPPRVIERLEATLQLPNGIILVTGPTGSGKTTTLFSALLRLNSVTRKVVTVEDPVEYRQRGINQIHVNRQIDLTFANLLRSIVRHDPDVIMVGEIRDLETADIAFQAALTGRLVLSTVHTNSAAATISRLRDMGLEDYLVTAVLRGVLAQRLVRRLCVNCRRPVEAPPEIVERFALDRRTAERPIMLWEAVGCAECRRMGYHGRQAIAEFLEPDAAIKRLIFAHAEHAEIEAAAVAGGMRPMFDAGLDAVLAGTTTIEEVVRSIRAEI